MHPLSASPTLDAIGNNRQEVHLDSKPGHEAEVDVDVDGAGCSSLRRYGGASCPSDVCKLMWQDKGILQRPCALASLLVEEIVVLRCRMAF